MTSPQAEAALSWTPSSAMCSGEVEPSRTKPSALWVGLLHEGQRRLVAESRHSDASWSLAGKICTPNIDRDYELHVLHVGNLIVPLSALRAALGCHFAQM